MVAALDFKRKLDYGQLGETKIAVWFRYFGNYVLPAYEKEIDDHKGPRLFAPKGELVVPDMLVIKGAKVRWIEAKHKSVFTWHWRTSRWMTGINLRHYQHYQEVATTTPWPIWLFFLHEKDREPKRNEPWPCHTGLYGQELSVLVANEAHRWGDMVYWAESALRKFAELEQVNAVYQKWSNQ